MTDEAESFQHLPNRRRTFVRGGLLLILFGLFVFGLVIVARQHPSDNPYFPKCLSKQQLDIECPGCGSGRALHHLLNGRIGAAAACNVLAVFFLPYVAVEGFRMALRWGQGRPPRGARAKPWVLWFIVIAFIAFAVLRNLPYEPFTVLAPHELGR